METREDIEHERRIQNVHREDDRYLMDLPEYTLAMIPVGLNDII